MAKLSRKAAGPQVTLHSIEGDILNLDIKVTVAIATLNSRRAGLRLNKITRCGQDCDHVFSHTSRSPSEGTAYPEVFASSALDKTD
jgi:hypothetical protein